MAAPVRRLHRLPRPLPLLLALALALQGLWHFMQPPPAIVGRDLPAPLDARAYRLLALDEAALAARLIDLWLQAFDTQPGVSLPFRQLDYHRLMRWLDTGLALNPRSQYPMLVAAHIYGSVRDAARKRLMMDYLYRRFLEDPKKNWRWLAHAVIVARHELHDLPLAMRYARALRQRTRNLPEVPYWAKDMQIFVLEDMGELEAAKALVGAMLESGVIEDRYERAFLTQRLASLQAQLSAP